ncbi:MAG TPA: 23S rRNA (pseudouridine(1915)-N(3))-methyltransferase RlmH [Planctomycetota bacterium]|jgi:23S rRNA (pseudouridine1915-N3)-methyltransferase
MKLLILAVGKLRSAPLRQVCEDYLARLSRYGHAEVKEVKAAESATPAQSVAQESARLLDELEPTDQVCVLDERGKELTSIELAELLKSYEMRAAKRLVFIIGGAYGLSDAVRKRGRPVALSRLTFPHELCRVVMLEQLYRARTIQRGEPYHHK